MSEPRNQHPSISNLTRHRSRRVVYVCLSALAVLGAVSIRFANRQIVIDTSPSVAPGLYVRSSAAPAVGQLVEFRIPASVRSYIHSRTGHDGKDWYILKPIVAGPGDRVDTARGELRINDHFVAPMPPIRDGFGKLLPRWMQNRVLGRDEYFVFSDRIPNSFDSRCYPERPGSMSQAMSEKAKDFTPSEAAELHTKSTFRAVSIFTFDFVTYVAFIIAILLVRSVPLKIGLGISAGMMAGLLFVVGHDCAHQSFTRYRALNRWMGRLALLPALHPYGTWDLSHNKTHHRYTNQRGRDYVWEPLSLPEYRQLTLFQRWKYRFFRSIVGHAFYNIFEIWWPRLFFPRSTIVGRWDRGFILDHALVAGWIIFFPALQLLFTAYAIGVGLPEALHRLPYLLLFTMVIPFIYFQTLFSVVIYLHHTHPAVVWRQPSEDLTWLESQIANTVHVIFPGPVNFVFHWIMEHTAHHLRPGIPMYNLTKAQSILEARHHEIIVHRWTIHSHLDVLRRCKLFDTDLKTWTDYDGSPTSTPYVRQSIQQQPTRTSIIISN